MPRLDINLIDKALAALLSVFKQVKISPKLPNTLSRAQKVLSGLFAGPSSLGAGSSSWRWTRWAAIGGLLAAAARRGAECVGRGDPARCVPGGSGPAGGGPGGALCVQWWWVQLGFALSPLSRL